MIDQVVIDYNDTASDICMLLGEEGKHWDPLVVDVPEWTLPEFCHQN